MKPLILAILDGWGLSLEKRGNSIQQANTPTMDKIYKMYPAVSLQASGIAVGMPWGEAGNSEVGHLTMGAGRVIYQRMPRIVLAIRDGSFFKNPALIDAVNHVKKNDSCLHFMGMVSSGNIHSYIDHIFGLIELAKQNKVKKVRIHAFTDGKDAPQNEGIKMVEKIQQKLKELEDGKIATVMGRHYPMDREKNWDLIQKAYQCMVNGKGEQATDPLKVIDNAYQQEVIDTFIKPTVIVDPENKQPLGLIKPNDSVVFFNFREDRARQLAKAFAVPDFKKFPREKIANLCFVTMTEYEEGLSAKVAFPPVEIKNHLTEVLSNKGKKILKVAETEKYAHVTYFFNGGKEKKYPGEEWILIPSRFAGDYSKHPEMSADRVTQQLIQAVNESKPEFILVNYANPDMVGHSGDFQAGIKAAEFLDREIKKLLGLSQQGKCTLLITADHGNLEKMIDLNTGEPYPEHSQNPVPFCIIDNEFKLKKPNSEQEIENMHKQSAGILCDIAPTVLNLMNISGPKQMTGQNLLDFLN